ncbi:hypothetical protein N7466_007136 [Penicillium verhagenii]|uniref:uncharacterized protein n=1 Tax=Penicillium verhagenii TaxID=1562060 RepID=UPI002544DDEF|nr:uncharacterized protein N7466_007136 [Penicillium verhagenii]KAJ5928180.1 hypothetical protein N7466_007136 [Penicillium verhagenii]
MTLVVLSELHGHEVEIHDTSGQKNSFLSSWAAAGSAPITGITDFAKDLLYSIKFAKGEDLEELELGQRPIIFIVHSMGGLVVKRANIMDQNDDQYPGIVSSISAILCLATPHHGFNLADILNKIPIANLMI